jgi:Flp pilus assembly protein CpaB
MTYRLRNIAVAVGLALVAALLTTFYVANYKRHVRQTESTVKVFVAKRDIPQGTPGTELAKRGWMVTADVVQRTVVPGAISNPDQVGQLLSTQPIYAGEQITLRRFATHAEQGIRAQLHGTLRAMSIPGSADQLLAGTLKDGDHVDLVVNLKGNGSDNNVVRDILRNLLVLHAPDNSASAKATGTNSLSVILAVSDRIESQKVFYTLQNSAGWTLQLRPVANATDAPLDLEGPTSMLKDGATTASLNHYANGASR